MGSQQTCVLWHAQRSEKSLNAARRPGRLDCIEACLQEARESIEEQPSKKRKVAGAKRPQERSSEALSSSAGLREFERAASAREKAARAALAEAAVQQGVLLTRADLADATFRYSLRLASCGQRQWEARGGLG